MRPAGATSAPSTLAICPEAKTRWPAFAGGASSAASRTAPLGIGWALMTTGGLLCTDALSLRRGGERVKLRDRFIARDDVGAMILPHVIQRVVMGIAVRRGDGVRQHIDTVVEVESVNHGMLHARLGPGTGKVKPVDVQLPQDGIEPGRVEGAVVLLANLEVSGPGIEFVDDFGIRGTDDAMRPIDLEMLVDWNLLGKKIVLDEDDVEPGLPSAVDNPPHRCEQLPGIERVWKRGIAVEEALEQVDDDDGAAGANGMVSLPTVHVKHGNASAINTAITSRL